MDKKLTGKKVAILAADGFEQIEMTKPREALDEAGAETKIVSIKSGKIQGVNHDEKGDKFDVDLTLGEARADDFDALLIPGGLMNPDAMRQEESAIEFVRGFFDAGKPVAVICHGPQVLINADLVRGRTMTSWPALQVDMRNAGAYWVDEEVVVDNGLVSSRNPDDIPAFNEKMIEEFAEGRHPGMQQPEDDGAPVALET
ncbi:MAG: type 1 glutamine amidotransferase [Chthoniobacterales bacterium]|nr:type 1 glutamine amidotransferase [Chthoniobacterales bacterium]